MVISVITQLCTTKLLRFSAAADVVSPQISIKIKEDHAFSLKAQKIRMEFI